MGRFAFCTFFDHRYLLKGLALHSSVRQHYDLWIVCLDDLAFKTLSGMSLPGAHLVAPSEFEDDELRAVKSSRTAAEYCFTCTPSVPLYVLKRQADLDAVFYVDADMFFFADPAPIWEEFANHSILIVAHRFGPKDAHMAQRYGIYNVGLMGFRRDENAFECLNWWRQRCIEWCYVQTGGGGFADQKYLDDWPTRFTNVIVAEHKGVGLAPWNINNYQITSQDSKIFADECPLVLYHYHAFREFGQFTFSLTSGEYAIPRRVVRLIYAPYVEAIRGAVETVRATSSDFAFPWHEGQPAWKRRLRDSRLYPYLWHPLLPLRDPKFVLRAARRAVLCRKGSRLPKD